MFTLGGGAISWRSRKQPTVSTSSTEDEYVACALAAKEAIWLRRLLGELQIFFDKDAFDSNKSATNIENQVSHQNPLPNIPTTRIHCNNQGAIALTKNPEQSKKVKHIDIAYHFVRERVESKELEMVYISTEDMVADDLIKALSAEKHNKHMETMGVGLAE